MIIYLVFKEWILKGMSEDLAEAVIEVINTKQDNKYVSV